MVWGRNTSGSSKLAARSTTTTTITSPVSAVLPLDEAQRRAHEATEAIRNADIILKTPKQPGQRKRAHSFSLPFFNAQRAAAKQEAQRQRKAGGGGGGGAGEASNTPTLPLPTSPFSPGLDSSSTLRFFPVRAGSRAAVTDIQKLAVSDLASGPSRKQSMADDDDFGCCGLSDAVLASSDDRDCMAHHRSEDSTSSAASTATTSLSPSRASDEMQSNTSTTGTSRADLSFDTKRESVPSMATHLDIEKEVDAIDVSELLDSTLMPAVMSPATLAPPSSAGLTARHAISMPSLRAQAAAQRAALGDDNESGRLSPLHAATSALDKSTFMPLAGDLNALRLQLGPAMYNDPAHSMPLHQPAAAEDSQANAPHLPARSPLRARRQKQPLTILPLNQCSPPTPALGHDLDHEDQKSPVTPLPTTPNGLGLALLRARRSKSSLKLANFNSTAGPLSPPPCPPPATPLPQLPTAVGRNSTASDATDVSIAPKLSLETQNPDFFVFGFAF